MVIEATEHIWGMVAAQFSGIERYSRSDARLLFSYIDSREIKTCPELSSCDKK